MHFFYPDHKPVSGRPMTPTNRTLPAPVAPSPSASVSPNLGRCRGGRCGRGHPCQLPNPRPRDQINPRNASTDLAEEPIFAVVLSIGRYRTRKYVAIRSRRLPGDVIGQFYSQFFRAPSRACPCILLATVHHSGRRFPCPPDGKMPRAEGRGVERLSSARCAGMVIGMQMEPTSASKRNPPGSVEYPLGEGVQGVLSLV